MAYKENVLVAARKLAETFARRPVRELRWGEGKEGAGAAVCAQAAVLNFDRPSDLELKWIFDGTARKQIKSAGKSLLHTLWR